MGFFERIARWLTTSSDSEGARPLHPDLQPIDVAGLVKSLGLADEARRLGAGGVPAPDATAPSGPETAAIQRVEKSRQDYVDWAVARLAVVHQSLRRGDVTADVNRARAAAPEFEREAEALLGERESVLRTLADAARARRDELAAFRARHRLDRDARYPGTAGAVLRIAFLGFLVVVEGVLNASFFAQGLDSGLIGGAAYAMALAALNVGVSYGFGRGPVRWMHHVAPGLRLVGLVSLLLALAAMTTMGLSIAHFRDALTGGLPHPAAAALETLQQSPWHLRDIASWGLFGISLAFGLGALLDGLWSDDPYPGYGAVSRRARLALEDHEEELQALREDLEALQSTTLATLDETVHRLQAALAIFAASIEDKRATGSRLHTALRDADHALEAVLQKFRTENQLARGALPRPAYFDAPVVLRPLALPDFDTTEDQAALRAQRAQVDVLLGGIETTRAQVRAIAQRAFDRVAGLGPAGTTATGGVPAAPAAPLAKEAS
jgi:hypothetical protein